MGVTNFGDDPRQPSITRKSTIGFRRIMVKDQENFNNNNNKCLRCVSLALNIGTGQMEIRIAEDAPWNSIWPTLPASEFTSMRVEQKPDLKRGAHHYVTSVYVNGRNEFSTGHSDPTTTTENNILIDIFDENVRTELWVAFPLPHEDQTVIKDIDLKAL